MRIVLEARACSILRNLLQSLQRTDRSRGVFLLPANVCPVVPLTFLTVGYPFEFVDIDPVTLCLDRALVERRLANRGAPVAGILFVRTYGAYEDVSDAFKSWKNSNPPRLLIDDRCLCPPQTEELDYQGADVVLFSTGYGKYVDLGFGGFAYVSEAVDYQRSSGAFSARHAALITERYKARIASESRFAAADLDGAHDWIPSSRLDIATPDYLSDVQRRAEHVAAHKAAINDVYRQRTPAVCQLDSAFMNWRFQIRTDNKAVLLQRIFAAGHFASGHYYPASRLFGSTDCPIAEQLHDTIVNLFNDFAMTTTRAMHLADLVAEHLTVAPRSASGEV